MNWGIKLLMAFVSLCVSVFLSVCRHMCFPGNCFKAVLPPPPSLHLSYIPLQRTSWGRPQKILLDVLTGSSQDAIKSGWTPQKNIWRRVTWKLPPPKKSFRETCVPARNDVLKMLLEDNPRVALTKKPNICRSFKYLFT